MLFTHDTCTEAFLLQFINLKVFCVFDVESYVVVRTSVFEFIKHLTIVLGDVEFLDGSDGCSLKLSSIKWDRLEHFSTSFATTVGWAYFLLTSESRSLTFVIKGLVVKCLIEVFNFEIAPAIGACMPSLGHESNIKFLGSMVHFFHHWSSIKPFSFIFRCHCFIVRYFCMENLTASMNFR